MEYIPFLYLLNTRLSLQLSESLQWASLFYQGLRQIYHRCMTSSLLREMAQHFSREGQLVDLAHRKQGISSHFCADNEP